MKPLLPLNDFLNTPDFWMLLLCNAFMGEDRFRELIESMKNEETSDMLEKGKVIIMGPERMVVKEWLRTVDRDRALQSANFNLSQVVQNATIVGQLKPYPTPAYIVSSPYQSSTGGTTTT